MKHAVHSDTQPKYRIFLNSEQARSTMHVLIFAAAMVSLFLVFISFSNAAEENKGLYDLCPPKSKQPASICSEYLKIHFPDQYDNLRLLVDSLDGRKDQARDWARADERWILGSKWIIVFLGFLATVMISLDKLGQLDLRKWAIIPSALVASIAAISSFYDFGKSHSDNKRAQTQYAFLLQDLEYSLVTAVEGNDRSAINASLIKDYWIGLHEVVEGRKEDFLKIMTERGESLKAAE